MIAMPWEGSVNCTATAWSAWEGVAEALTILSVTWAALFGGGALPAELLTPEAGFTGTFKATTAPAVTSGCEGNVGPTAVPSRTVPVGPAAIANTIRASNPPTGCENQRL